MRVNTTARFDNVCPRIAVDHTKVGMVGAGNIGGWLGTILGKLGVPKWVIHDMDSVELENVGVQIYGHCDIGYSKVETLHELIENSSPHDKVSVKKKGRFNSKFKNKDLLSCNVIVSAVDNLPTRREIFDLLKNSDLERQLFIDGRLSAQMAELRTIELSGGKIVHGVPAKEFLASTEGKGARVPCGQESSPHVGPVLAGFMAQEVVKFLTGRPTVGYMLIDLDHCRLMAQGG